MPSTPRPHLPTTPTPDLVGDHDTLEVHQWSMSTTACHIDRVLANRRWVSFRSLIEAQAAGYHLHACVSA